MQLKYGLMKSKTGFNKLTMYPQYLNQFIRKIKLKVSAPETLLIISHCTEKPQVRSSTHNYGKFDGFKVKPRSWPLFVMDVYNVQFG